MYGGIVIPFTQYLKNYHGLPSPFLIVGSASTLREDILRIKNYIHSVQPIIIGINQVTRFIIPHYHLWTNKERFQNLGGCIHPLSMLLCGIGLSDDLIKTHYKGEYLQVEYQKFAAPSDPIYHIDGQIYGFYRIAGCLAIMIAHILNASTIHVVGFDGYTRYKPEEYKPGLQQKNQHCYGAGHTDDYSWKDSIKKDDEIYKCLLKIKDSGIDFQIITESIYDDVYDHTILENYDV